MLSTFTNLDDALAAAIIAVEDAWDCAYDGYVFRYRKDKLKANEKLSEVLKVLQALQAEKL